MNTVGLQPIFTVVKNKETIKKVYEMNDVEELTALSEMQVLSQKGNTLTAIGINDGYFVVQRVSEQFGGGVKLQEGVIESLSGTKLYGDMAAYIGAQLEEILPMEYIAEIGAYKGNYNYNGDKITVWYSGATKENIWLSCKPFKDEEFKPMGNADLSKYLNVMN